MLLVAALTFAAMWNARRLSTKVPPVLVGLGCGIVALLCHRALRPWRPAGPGDRSADGECRDARRAGGFLRAADGRAAGAVGVGDPVGRAGAGGHRVDRRAVVRQADQPARRASRRRRSPADSPRHRQRDFGRLRRHHQRHQYRSQPRQPRLRRAQLAFGDRQCRGGAGGGDAAVSGYLPICRARCCRRSSW